LNSQIKHFVIFFIYRIIKGVLDNSKTCGVQALDARFVAGVLRDAEKLDWGEGELYRRKFVVEKAMSQHIAAAWEEEADLFGLWNNSKKRRNGKDDNNEIFRRHGWNTVDSGFSLWGAGRKAGSSTDKFLKSKGWNDIDSGFRII
jgi:hypothetical protein